MQPERKKLLKKVFMEDSDSSEDEFGQPKYIREKDENYLADIKEIERKHLEYERERQKIIKENERRKREGNSQQLRVPPANEALRSKEKKTYQYKFRSYERDFYERQRIIERNTNNQKYSVETEDDPNAKEFKEALGPQNQFNSMIRNNMLTKDRRIEMAILAIR